MGQQAHWVTPEAANSANPVFPGQVFDYETETERMHYIPIEAVNVQPPSRGGQPYSVSGTLTVTITDVNDNPLTIVGGP